MNYGFIPPPRNPDDYIFGGVSKLRGTPLTDGNWTSWLPEKEFQSHQGFDTYGCTVYGTLNCLEILWNFYKKEKKNWAERYLAVLAGNTREGNHPQAVIEAARKKGLIDDALLPFTPEIDSFEKWASPKPMTEDLLSVGKMFLDENDIGHEWVGTDPNSIKEALKYSPLGVSVCAWFERDGKYYFPQGMMPNHWCCLYNFQDGVSWSVFDSYDNTFKLLEWNVPFLFVKRYAIGKNVRLALLERILETIGRLIPILSFLVKRKIEEQKPIVIPPKTEWVEPIETMQEMVLRICKQEGLTEQMTQQLYKTIQCESNFNPEAVNKNKNGTTDWGICQYNDFWYIGKGKPIPSVDVALHDAEYCVKVMCRQFKAGRAKDWICYRNLF